MARRIQEQVNLDDRLQKRFTAYLYTAVRRKQADYIDRWHKQQILCGIEEWGIEDRYFDLEEQALKDMPLHMRLQNETLYLAIARLTERERYVFFNCALAELTMEQMSRELGLSYKGVASLYYRTIQKLRKSMCGGAK